MNDREPDGVDAIAAELDKLYPDCPPMDERTKESVRRQIASMRGRTMKPEVAQKLRAIWKQVPRETE